jgi:quinolinate synthase
MRERHPGVPIVTYVNTSAAVKAESDICCTSGNAKKIVEALGVRSVIMLPDEYLARNIAAQTEVEIIAWKGHCEVHERFTAEDIRECATTSRGHRAGASRNARPRSSPNATSPARPRRWPIMSARKRPARVVLLTECSMSDNVALQYPDLDFVRPCNLCPHMKRITLPKIRRALETMTPRGDRRAGDRRRARAHARRSSACWRSAEPSFPEKVGTPRS